MKATIWHNPKCGTSRKTLAILEETPGVEVTVVEYLKTPPNADEITELLGLLGLEPRDLMRRKEAAYKEAGLDNPDLSRDALIKGMADNPALIERPIVVKGKKAVLGRPPENVLELI